MRIPTSETNDTLDAASLPPTEGTELNDRTRPDVGAEIRFTHDTLKFAVSISVVAAIADRFLVPEYLGYAAIALFGVVWWFVPDATRPDADAPGRTFEFRLWLVAVLVGCVALHEVSKTSWKVVDTVAGWPWHVRKLGYWGLKLQSGRCLTDERFRTTGICAERSADERRGS